jgi:hypothetical protein
MEENLIVHPPNLGMVFNCIVDGLYGTSRNLGCLRLKILQHFNFKDEKEDTLVADMKALKEQGWNIPNHIKYMEVSYEDYVKTAVGLDRMGIDWHTENMSKLIQYYSKNK